MIVRTPLGAVGLDAAGAGEPVVLLHGFPLDRTLWAPQLADPAPGFRYLAPDLPGFGESDRLGAAGMDPWADWVVALLDALGIARATIGGLSMGGYLAMACWRRHPHRVRALVFADTRAGADSDEGRAKRREMQALLRTEGIEAVVERMRPGMTGRATRRLRPEAVEALDAMMRRAHPDAVHDALQALMDRPDSTATIASVTVPTLILCGDQDILTPLAESRAMQAAIAGSALGVVPEAGHASNFEVPAVFNRLLSEFLGANIRADQS